ncbi:uncharacterized protein BO95DRAFT_440637 [Aspergillus brunneoviolaceus CBS 621.78]|uniref:Uncharacterized protein n=1 Tax=Aspergillus brunneoviolaceus CBS 621.78 TaxID=1450534 RepID=A0ACD1GGJ8_9EURO|nr:hypothetical protein BO95DRAFT_440637 [Aspergillus brunneoviolaceus CBS 621.78]RAH48295.1 hypothetical protein BO95DRAFT_440637 [Aspergillus brunneoviolaceus CBS 621.78]
MTKSYTLCQDAMSYYSPEDDNFIMCDLMTNTPWYSEWDRVCDLVLSQPTPAIPFQYEHPPGHWQRDGDGFDFGRCRRGLNLNDCVCLSYGDFDQPLGQHHCHVYHHNLCRYGHGRHVWRNYGVHV